VRGLPGVNTNMRPLIREAAEYLHVSEMSKELQANLKRQGSRVGSGQLFLSDGKNSPEEMIRYLATFMKEAGPLRLVGDGGAWALRKNWNLEAIKALEEAGNFKESQEGKLFLCQYGLEDFSGAHVMMAAEMHSHVIYKGGLVKSLYYNRNSYATVPAVKDLDL
jgi:hypothetical protein